MKRPSESEIYFARKNRRREWWGRNWRSVMVCPVVTIFIGVTLIALFIVLSRLSFQIGKDYDKAHHPQDWQHWHWETNFYITTNIYYTNIYNRS